MPPIDPTNTLDTAARWGPEIFLAVLILLLGSGFLYVFGRQMFTVIENNTRALIQVSLMVAKSYEGIQEHESNTVKARGTVNRIDETTKDTNSMVKDMWKGVGK